METGYHLSATPSEAPEGKCYNSLQDLVCVVMAFLLPQLLSQLLVGGNLVLLISTTFSSHPKSLVQCLTLGR